MEKTRKRLEEMTNDVKEGDLVKIILNDGLSSYVGYVWDYFKVKKVNSSSNLLDKGHSNSIFWDYFIIETVNDLGKLSDTGHNHGPRLFLCGLDPLGRTEITNERNTNYLLDNIQFSVVDLSDGTFGKEKVSGYEILERHRRSFD